MPFGKIDANSTKLDAGQDAFKFYTKTILYKELELEGTLVTFGARVGDLENKSASLSQATKGISGLL